MFRAVFFWGKGARDLGFRAADFEFRACEKSLYWGALGVI